MHRYSFKSTTAKRFAHLSLIRFLKVSYQFWTTFRKHSEKPLFQKRQILKRENLTDVRFRDPKMRYSISVFRNVLCTLCKLQMVCSDISQGLPVHYWISCTSSTFVPYYNILHSQYLYIWSTTICNFLPFHAMAWYFDPSHGPFISMAYASLWCWCEAKIVRICNLPLVAKLFRQMYVLNVLLLCEINVLPYHSMACDMDPPFSKFLEILPLSSW